MPCNLKKKHFVVDDWIITINTEKGETKAAARTLPLPDAVGERLLSHISNKGDDDFVIGIRIVRRNHPESDSGLVSD